MDVYLKRLPLMVNDEELKGGMREGYPRCCVEWFTFVWSPVCCYLLFSGVGDRTSLDAAKRMLGPVAGVGYVQCPRCRKVNP